MTRLAPHTSETWVDDKSSPGRFHIVTTQDVEPVLRALHSLPDHIKRKVSTQNGTRFIGSVPNVLAVAWAKEWGVVLYSKEWLSKAKRRIETDTEWSKLKVHY